MRNYVRLNDLNLTLGFLREPEVKRKEMLVKIMEESFHRMTATNNIDQKAEVTTGLLQRSLKKLEEEESYEECQVFHQLLEVIPEVVTKIKSNEGNMETR